MADPAPREADSALVESGRIDPSEQRIAFSSKQAFDIPSIRSSPKGWKPLLNISAKEDCGLSGVTQPGRRAQETLVPLQHVGLAGLYGTDFRKSPGHSIPTWLGRSSDVFPCAGGGH